MIPYAFKGCTSLTSIVVEEGNSVYDSREGCNAIIETATNKLIRGGNSTIIPSSVTSIGVNTFDGCTSLTSIVIPESVTEIGYGAFKRCSSLTSIVVEEGNSKYDSREGCNAIIETRYNLLIQGCNSTIIPSSVTNIWGSAFLGCSSLTSIEIPSSVTMIDSQAFEDCTSLTSVVIPESVTEIGYKAFRGCSSLKSVVINGKIKMIEEHTFESCTALESITLPAGVKEIYDNAFDGCTSIKAINVPAKKKDYYVKRLPEKLHSLIVEIEPVKKSKKK
jgi:hypothetical protein